MLAALQHRERPGLRRRPGDVICIGLNDGSCRVYDDDIFRKCVKGVGTVDRREDCDRHDLLDEALVIMQGLSIAENITEAMDEEGEDDDTEK